MKRFWDGFEKRALQDTRLKEDLVTAATSAVPLGTTLHTALKDKKGGNRGWEWSGRILGDYLGYAGGKALMHRMKAGRHLSTAGGYAASAAAEVLANRLIHRGKYDAKGTLKARYKSKED